MPDKRTDFQRAMWERVGPPLYYCEECLLAVKVEPVPGGEAVITRPCEGCTCGIIAPRKSILAGKGGLSMSNKARMLLWKIKAALTNRCA